MSLFLLKEKNTCQKLNLFQNPKLFKNSQTQLLTIALEIPSINELRYAGKHFADASVEELNGKFSATKCLIEKAVNHCQLAQYDAIEARLGFFTTLNLVIFLCNSNWRNHI